MKNVKYILIAEVEDELVFRGEYGDSIGLEEEIYKAERAVETKLAEDYEDINE